MMRIAGYMILALSVSFLSQAQRTSEVWQPDNGDGTYTNPVIHADYSDPDAIRVGNYFYMTASSFTQVPGLPLLRSSDLVNWELVGHALHRQPPYARYDTVQHGSGVWAPSIRYHKNEFYIYYPDPDLGIYLVRAKSITGPWTEPQLILAGKGLIDPCPLWDDNGKAYLIHAYAGSRAGIKSILVVREMDPSGTRLIGDPVLVFDGHQKDPTVEGPKFYKRNGFYYIFAPAGGVATGWQLVLRAKNIYGPYERKVVLAQGQSPINGPHQGAWVTTAKGEDWFLHFQDKEAYGRIVHLQPMRWVRDWPVIGEDPDGDGTGQPVQVHKKPATGLVQPKINPVESDEFDRTRINAAWQWQANPQSGWIFPTQAGYLRMNLVLADERMVNKWSLPNILGQKFPAEEFTATVKLKFIPHHDGDEFGFMVHGTDYAVLSLKQKNGSMKIVYSQCLQAEKNQPETIIQEIPVEPGTYWLRLSVTKGGICRFFYSLDGEQFEAIQSVFQAKPGKWVGARMGFFGLRTTKTNDAGFADLDWFRVGL